MNKLLLISIAFLCFMIVSAQVTQNGRVLEYNGKGPKTALTFVRINAENEASPTMSDESGDFELVFHKLNPGDKITNLIITKPGYVLFNKSALEKMRLSEKTTFDIIMCKEDKFNELVQFYFGLSTKSQEEYYKKELGKIDSLRKQDEKSYYSLLNELTNKIERERKARQELAEIVARIDKSELNKLDSTVFSLINLGKIEEAIEVYEEAKLYEKLEQSKKKLKVSQELIDQGESEEKITSESLDRYINTLKLKGGKDNYEKLYELYERKAMADTTDFNLVFESAKFFHDQNRFKTSEYLYYICLRIAQSVSDSNSEAYHTEVARALNGLANLHFEMHRYTDSEKEYLEAIEIIRKLSNQSPDVYLPSVAETLNGVALLHNNLNRYTESEKEYVEALEIRRSLATQNPEAYLPSVAETLNGLALLHNNLNRYSESEKEYIDALEIRRRLATYYPETYLSDVAETLNGFALLHNNYNRYKESEKKYIEALEIRRKLSAQNPDAYLPDVAGTLSGLALLHQNLNRYTESEKEYVEALEIYRNLFKKEPDAYLSDIVSTLGKLSYGRLLIKQFDKAGEVASEAITMCKEKNMHEDMYSWIYTNLAHALLLQNKFTEAKNVYIEWKDKPYPMDTSKTFNYFFLQDFNRLEKAGITHRGLAKIRKILNQ